MKDLPQTNTRHTMTVGQLVERINEFPQNAPICRFKIVWLDKRGFENVIESPNN